MIQESSQTKLKSVSRVEQRLRDKRYVDKNFIDLRDVKIKVEALAQETPLSLKKYIGPRKPTKRSTAVTGSAGYTSLGESSAPRGPEFLEGVTSVAASTKPLWPVRRVSEVPGDLVLGGLMMVHERSDTETCGPVMPQGGIQVNATYILLNYVCKARHLKITN